MEGLFLCFFLLKGGEREGEKRSFRASFSLLRYLLHFLPALSHLLEEKANFWKNSQSFFFPNQPVPSSPTFFYREGETKRQREKTQMRENMVKRDDKKKGTLETAVGEVSWRFPAINFSPSQLAHLKQIRAGASQSPNMKRDRTQLDLVGKLFTSGALKSTIEQSARKRDSKRNAKKGWRNERNSLLKE